MQRINMGLFMPGLVDKGNVMDTSYPAGQALDKIHSAMKKVLKRILQKHLDSPFVSQHLGTGLDVKNFPQGYFKSFGDKNPDKIFYVIWINSGGSGFFSNFSNVLCHLKIADQAGMI